MSPTTGASRVTGSGPGCHPPCEEQPERGETSARPLVTKLAHTFLHIYSPPELFCPFPSKLSLFQVCNTISPLTKVPVSSSCQPCPHSSPFPALISLLSHSQFPVPSLFAMHFQFSLISPPSLSLRSHPHHIQFPLLISFPFTVNAGQGPTSLLPGLNGIQGHGGDKPCALRPGTALPSQGRSCAFLHWGMLCADDSFGVQIEKVK